MKIAVAQLNCQPGEVQFNTDLMLEYVVRAREQGAELILFPEIADVGYAFDALPAAASTWQEGPVAAFKAAAIEQRIYIAAGLTEKTTDCIYNAMALIDPHGEVQASYRKIHLFKLDEIDESKRFGAGNQIVTTTIGVFTVGLAICYDLRFPEQFRSMFLQGVDVVLLPSAWPFPREEAYQTLRRARAIENQCYMICANRVGQDHDITFSGHSAVIAPDGSMLTKANDKDETLLIAEIAKEKIESVRAAMPVINHRRTDVY